MKKRGFIAGKWNGYGGKVEGEETQKAAAVRELKEEAGLIVREDALRQVALIRFSFDGKPAFESQVFLIQVWHGEPVETEEMRPRWFPLSAIPFNEMMPADARWIFAVLNGETLEADVNFNAEGTAVKSYIAKPATFS